MTETALIESFKALGHPVRYSILQALATGERNVSVLEDVTGIGQPGLSQQLAVLRKARLVTTRREAKQVFYAIAIAEVAQIQAAIGALLPTGEAALASTGPTNRHAGVTGAAVFATIGH